MKGKVKKLKINKDSSFVLADDCILKNVEIDGHLEIKNPTEKEIEICHNKKNYKEIIDTSENDLPILRIRGYKIKQ